MLANNESQLDARLVKLFSEIRGADDAYFIGNHPTLTVAFDGEVTKDFINRTPDRRGSPVASAVASSVHSWHADRYRQSSHDRHGLGGAGIDVGDTTVAAGGHVHESHNARLVHPARAGAIEDTALCTVQKELRAMTAERDRLLATMQQYQQQLALAGIAAPAISHGLPQPSVSPGIAVSTATLVPPTPTVTNVMPALKGERKAGANHISFTVTPPQVLTAK